MPILMKMEQEMPCGNSDGACCVDLASDPKTLASMVCQLASRMAAQQIQLGVFISSTVDLTQFGGFIFGAKIKLYCKILIWGFYFWRLDPWRDLIWGFYCWC